MAKRGEGQQPSSGRRDSRTSARKPWWQSSVTAIFVVLILFGSYFFWHVRARETYFDQHNLRLLANAGAGVAQAVDGVQKQVLLALGNDERMSRLCPRAVGETRPGGTPERLALIRGFDPDPEVGSLLGDLEEAVADAQSTRKQEKEQQKQDRKHQEAQPQEPASHETPAPENDSEESDGEASNGSSASTRVADTSNDSTSVDNVKSDRGQGDLGATEVRISTSLDLINTGAVLNIALTEAEVGVIGTMGEVDLPSFLEPYLRSEVFETVLIVAPPGGSGPHRVVTQTGSTALRFHGLHLSEESAAPAPAGLGPLLGAPDQRLTGGSDLRTVRVGEASYRLYEQPVEVSFRKDAASVPQRWRIVGLVPRASLRSASMRISPNEILSVLALVGLLALSMPIMRMADLGSRATLRIRDVSTLVTALLGLAGFATLAVEDLTRFQKTLDFRHDDQLATVSENMSSGISSELWRMEQQLESLTRNWLRLNCDCVPRTDDAASETDGQVIQANVERDGDQTAREANKLVDGGESTGDRMERKDTQKSCFRPHVLEEGFAFASTQEPESGPPAAVKPDGDVAPPPYPGFEKAWWLAGRSHEDLGLEPGDQVGKWTTRGMTSLVRLHDRPYFRELIDGRPMQPAAGAVPNGNSLFLPGRYVQSIRSRTDGRESVVVSKRRARPVRAGGAETYQDSWEVAAIEAEAMSLFAPTLPPGFQFAVVDTSGKVLFHSDVNSNLIEDAFLEFTPSEALVAAVHTHTPRQLDVHYRDGSYNLRVTPLEDLPWSLLVFADVELLRGQHVEVLGSTIGVFSMHFLLVLVMVFGMWHMRRGSRPRGSAARLWFWPDPQHFGRGLRWLAVALALLCFVLFVDSAEGVEQIWRHATTAFLALSCLEQLYDDRARSQTLENVQLLTGPRAKLLAELKNCLHQRSWRSLAFAAAALAWPAVWILGALGHFSPGLLVAAGVLLFLARDAFLTHAAALGLFATAGGPSAQFWWAIPCVGVVLVFVWAPLPRSLRLPVRSWIKRCTEQDSSWIPVYNATLVLAIALLAIQPMLMVYDRMCEEAVVVHAKLQQDGLMAGLEQRAQGLGRRYRNVPMNEDVRGILREEFFPFEQVPAGLEERSWKRTASRVSSLVPQLPEDVFLDGWTRPRPLRELELPEEVAQRSDYGMAWLPTEVSCALSQTLPPFSWTSYLQRQALWMGEPGRQEQGAGSTYAYWVHDVQIPDEASADEEGAQDQGGPDGIATGGRRAESGEAGEDGRPQKRRVHDVVSRHLSYVHGAEWSHGPAAMATPEDGVDSPAGGSAADAERYAFGLATDVRPLERRDLTLAFVYTLGAGALFYALVAFLTQRLFLTGRMRISPRAAVGDKGLMQGNSDQLLVGELPHEKESLSPLPTFPLAPGRLVGEELEQLRQNLVRHDVVLVTGVERCLADPHSAEVLLDLLEEILALEGRPRLLLASLADPLHLLTAMDHDRARYGEDAEGGALAALLARWGALAQGFEKLRCPQFSRAERDDWIQREKEKQDKGKGRNRDDSGGVPEEVRKALLEECVATPRLRADLRKIQFSGRLAGLTSDLVPERVLDEMETYYRSLWDACDQEEKLVLQRLAGHGFVNWRQRASLQRLIRRGLVQELPSYALMNESFRLFALQAEPPARIARWEEELDTGKLEGLRGVFVLALIVLGAFLFATQKEVFNQALALVAALATGGAMLLRVGGLTSARAILGSQEPNG